MRFSRIILLIGFCAAARADSPNGLKIADAALAHDRR
jgi:hypothetical protein